MELRTVTGSERLFLHRRAILLTASIVTIAIGLASRKIPWIFPAFLSKYPGDALWAMMIYWLLATAWPAGSVMRISTSSLIVSGLVEFSQLYQASWINGIRATTLGHLVLGRSFGGIDLVAYAAGILIAAVTDLLLLNRWRHSRQDRPPAIG